MLLRDVMEFAGDYFSDLRALSARPALLPPALAVLSVAWAFVFGACWGSFANVVIARVPEGLSVVWPRSRCPSCGTQIAARDNVPVLSWLLLRGRCRACGVGISARYPFVELLVGLFAVSLVMRDGWTLSALESFTFAIILVAIAFIDLDTWTVPHPLWIALAASGLLFGAAAAALADDWGLLMARVISGAGAGLFFAALVVVATGILRRMGRLAPDQLAMGWGDPLIVIGIGAFLGWRLLSMVVFLASLQGAVVGLALKARGHLRGDRPVSAADDWVPPAGALPFGPFLALGALEARFFGEDLLAAFVARTSAALVM